MTKWIPVTKKLPEEGVYVLVISDPTLPKHIPDHDDIFTAAYDRRLGSFTTEYWGDHDWLSVCEVTHWAYLPDGVEDE